MESVHAKNSQANIQNKYAPKSISPLTIKIEGNTFIIQVFINLLPLEHHTEKNTTASKKWRKRTFVYSRVLSRYVADLTCAKKEIVFFSIKFESHIIHHTQK